MTTIYGLKNCDTCRKALKSIGEAEFVDVRVTGVSAETLSVAFQHFGDAIVNKRSTTWRNLTSSEREEEPISLLMKHPTLMKRPLIEHGGDYFLGWGKDVQSALL